MAIQYMHRKPRKPEPLRTAFEVDDRITLKLDFELAMELSDILLDVSKQATEQGGGINPALHAMAVKLHRLAPPDNDDPERQ